MVAINSIQNIKLATTLRSVVCYLAAALLASAALPVAGEDIPVARLAGENPVFHEVHEPEVNVSGNVIVGVMTDSVLEALRQDMLGVRLGSMGTVITCLQVTSRDGSYQSKNDYTIDVDSRAVIRLPYDTNKKSVIKDLTGQQDAIAVSATSGNCKNSTTADFLLPARLDNKNARLDTGDVTIYINGFDATDVFFQVVGGDEAEFIDCNYIEEGRHTAYNFTCKIPAGLLASQDKNTIEILREVYGRELDPITFNLLSVSE